MAVKDSGKPKRRVIKKVETVREKAEKSIQKAEAAADGKKPGVIRLTFRYIGAPFRPLGRLLKKIGHFKPFRILGFILLPPYVRNSWKELRLVTWPTRRESWQLTLAVVLFAVIFGGIVTLVDYGLDKIFRQLLLK